MGVPLKAHKISAHDAHCVQILQIFWRSTCGDSRPRHLRSHLFDVFRLLLPHNDVRRYYLGVPRLARAVGQGMGLDKEKAAHLADTWLDRELWAHGADFSRGRDLACVLQHEWDTRFKFVPTSTSTRITVGELNSVLTSIDRAHVRGGHAKSEKLRQLITGRATGVEIKWLCRVILRDMTIGTRASMPVAHKGEWPKLVMDGFCRAQGRVGRPSTGNPPLLYSFFRHQHSLWEACRQAEAGELPTAYPPPSRLGIHIRVQGSTPCIDTSAATVLRSFAFSSQETDHRLYIETKHDGFRLQVHYNRATDLLRFFYRSGIDSTAELAPDLSPAMRLALGAPNHIPLADGDGQPLDRFMWLAAACGAAEQHDPSFNLNHWEPPQSVILDGELLVYDECETTPGRYDELGSRPGVVGFGTHFWISVVEAKNGEWVGGRYSREDCRRHYMVKVFDLLHLNGRDLVQEQAPLHERKELLRHAFRPIPHFVELTASELVDLGVQPDVVRERFDHARACGEEGLMLKAASRACVPNARANVLKLKSEFIPGLGDTVTLCIVGARYARRVGSGPNSALVCELACAAPSAAAAAVAASSAGPFHEMTWLFNTCNLSYGKAAFSVVDHEQLLWRLNEEILTGVSPLRQQGSRSLSQSKPLMRRLNVDEDPPAWLLHPPSAKERRPHFVLIDPSLAVKVEVLGSRFLTR